MAAWLRLFCPRFAAAFLACPESALWLAVLRGSRFSAPSTARERVAEGLRREFAAFVSSAAFLRVAADPFGGASFTPARRAFDSPMAMAC